MIITNNMDIINNIYFIDNLNIINNMNNIKKLKLKLNTIIILKTLLYENYVNMNIMTI